MPPGGGRSYGSVLKSPHSSTPSASAAARASSAASSCAIWTARSSSISCARCAARLIWRCAVSREARRPGELHLHVHVHSTCIICTYVICALLRELGLEVGRADEQRRASRHVAEQHQQVGPARVGAVGLHEDAPLGAEPLEDLG
eukprot:scaffold12318_cov74-Phaeocystis_antarctica.AAC.1